MSSRAEALQRLSRRAISDPADTLVYGARKQLLQDLQTLLDGPPPITTLSQLYAVPPGTALQTTMTKHVWLKTPAGWRRTGLSGVYSTEFVAQDLPLSLLSERPS